MGGTKGKIPAGPPANLCRMAKAFVAGVLGGAGMAMPNAGNATRAPGNTTRPGNFTKNLKQKNTGHGAVSMPFKGANADADNWREDKYAASAPYAPAGMRP